MADNRSARRAAEKAAAKIASDADIATEQAAADYADSWDKARAAGWSLTQLREMGYATPTAKRSRTATPSEVAARQPSGQDVPTATVPQQTAP